MTDDGVPELVEARLRDAARIEPLALDEEFVRMPSDIAWWTARHAAAIGHALRAKAKAKALRGLLYLQARDRITQAGGKPTEAQCDAFVDNDTRWAEAQEAEISADVERERLKGAVAALMAKRDMLVQMGANVRAEMERDPVVRDRARR